jgi:hypothetical protein
MPQFFDLLAALAIVGGVFCLQDMPNFGQRIKPLFYDPVVLTARGNSQIFRPKHVTSEMF